MSYSKKNHRMMTTATTATTMTMTAAANRIFNNPIFQISPNYLYYYRSRLINTNQFKHDFNLISETFNTNELKPDDLYLQFIISAN